MSDDKFWDQAACAALGGLLANARQDKTDNGVRVAKAASLIADEMVRERGRRTRRDEPEETGKMREAIRGGS